jgi:hypothetical protein
MDNPGFECPICLDLLSNPISLPCGHNFCYGCKKDFTILGTKKCPVCRREYPKTHYQVNNMIIHLISRFYPKYHCEKIVYKKKTKLFGYFVVVFAVVFALVFSQRRFRSEVLKILKVFPGWTYQILMRFIPWLLSTTLSSFQ